MLFQEVSIFLQIKIKPNDVRQTFFQIIILIILLYPIFSENVFLCNNCELEYVIHIKMLLLPHLIQFHS